MTEYVLVHGAWCTGAVWAAVAAGLTGRGHRVHIVDRLPGTGDAAGGLADDVAHVREVVRGCSGPGRPGAVLVAHSYAGMVAAELADEPAVAHTVHMASFWPKTGQSLVDLRSAWAEQWLDDPGDGTLAVTADVALAHRTLAADLPADEFAGFHAALLPQSVASCVAPATAPPPRHPTTYVRCLRDQAVFPSDQETMGASADVTVAVDAAHMVMLSRPAQVVEVLAAIG